MSELPADPSQLDRIGYDAAAAAANSAAGLEQGQQLGDQSYARDTALAASVGDVRRDVAGLGTGMDAGFDRVTGSVTAGHTETHRLLGEMGGDIGTLARGFQERWDREDTAARAQAEQEERLRLAMAERARAARQSAELARWERVQRDSTATDERGVERAGRGDLDIVAIDIAKASAKPRVSPDRRTHHDTYYRGVERSRTSPTVLGRLGGRIQRIAGQVRAPEITGGRMIAWGGRRGGIIGALSRGTGHVIRAGANSARSLASQLGIVDSRGREGKRRLREGFRRQHKYPYN